MMYWRGETFGTKNENLRRRQGSSHGALCARLVETQKKWRQRERTLIAAFRAHPERFPHGVPSPPLVPTQVWINKPQTEAAAAEPADQRAPQSAQAGEADAEQDNAFVGSAQDAATEKTTR